MQAGIDTHKETLAVAVLDDLGRPVEVCELPNTTAGFRRLTRLLDRHEVGRIGIEGAGNYGRAVAAHLVAWSADRRPCRCRSRCRMPSVPAADRLTARQGGRSRSGRGASWVHLRRAV
jgi:hypothetical protein